MSLASELNPEDLSSSPLDQFLRWLEEARAAGLPEPNAMVLATVSADGQPSARSVLLKGVDARGFTFYTNLGSRKGSELAANPRVSLVFPWYGVLRQVVVVGDASLVDRDEVDAYFATRPRGSQLGAWASRQSSVIEDRTALEGRMAELEMRYPGDTPVPAPEFWGGWLIRPQSVEFWQGRRSRLHDRLRFRAVGSSTDLGRHDDWEVERLSP